VFGSRLRLILHWFRSIRQAREEIAGWRTHYNTERPHSEIDPREDVGKISEAMSHVGTKATFSGYRV